MRTLCQRHLLLAGILCVASFANAQERAPNGRAKNPGNPGWCETPVADRKSDLGCYTTAIRELGVLPRAKLYWHLDTFPDAASAKANADSRSTVVDGHGKHWLFTIAEQSWRPRAGARAAMIGPLEIDPGVAYTARYMETVISPGFQEATGNGHRHPGPEAWYVVSGGQCLETPNGVMIGRAGQTMLAPDGWPMGIASVGADMRRTVVLILHRSAEPYVTAVDVTPDVPHAGWKPQGVCPK